MRANFLVLNLLIWASILWGCAPEVMKTIPSIDNTATQTPVMVASPKPSATVPRSIATGNETPPPSAAIPIATATKTPLLPAISLDICQPGELEIYLAELSPIADQIVILAHEVSQLEELSKSRAEEILAETIQLKPDLDIVTVPTCLEYAHQRAIDAIILLESSINSVLKEDFDTAKSDLQESFSAMSRTLSEIVVMSWELTATSTPTQ
jgi:hypothetical protein